MGSPTAGARACRSVARRGASVEAEVHGVLCGMIAMANTSLGTELMRSFCGIALAMLAAFAAPAAAQDNDVAGVERALRAIVESRGGDDREARYAVAFFDLNRDGRSEAIVHLVGPTLCGSGGCVTHVLTPTRNGYRSIGRMTVSRVPIRLLATSSNGWRDLSVAYSGGGMAPGAGRMRFNGTRYPGNPTVAPAASPAGRMLIGDEPEYRNLYR